MLSWVRRDDGENSVYSGDSIAVLEYTAYREGDKKKVFQGYQYILGIGSMDVFFVDGSGGFSLSRSCLANI
jgi:hypothetical protein